MKNTIIVIMTGIAFSFTNAYADKASEKGRLDDCYSDLAELGADVNAGSGRNVERNTKFMRKKERCNKLQEKYENKYGEYKTDADKALKEYNFSTLSADELILSFCTSKQQIAEYQPRLKGNLSKGEKSATSKLVKNMEFVANKTKDAYLKLTKKPIPEEECSPTFVSEEKVIRESKIQGHDFSKKEYLPTLLKNICELREGTSPAVYYTPAGETMTPEKLEKLNKMRDEMNKKYDNVMTSLFKKLSGATALCYDLQWKKLKIENKDNLENAKVEMKKWIDENKEDLEKIQALLSNRD